MYTLKVYRVSLIYENRTRSPLLRHCRPVSLAIEIKEKVDTLGSTKRGNTKRGNSSIGLRFFFYRKVK